MKKRYFLLLTALLLLSGCERTQKPSIEQTAWQVSLVQNRDGAVLAAGPDNRDFPGVPQVDLVCTAQDGTLTLEDHTNNTNVSGVYTRTKSDREAVIYEVTLDDQQGFAIVSTTEYQDGAAVPTLVLNVADHALYLYPQEEIS